MALFSLHAAQAAEERHEAEQWHRHTLDVLLVAERFRSSTFDMLRGERGYLLTDNDRFLQPYVEGRDRSRLLLRRLRELVSDNPLQTRNAAAVRQRLRAFAGLLDHTVDLHRRGNPTAALAIVRSGQGKEEFERLQASIDRLEAEERRLLIARRAQLDATGAANDRLGQGAALLITMLLGIAAVAAVAALRAQRRADVAMEELRRLAAEDDLTGLPNRRQFMGRLSAELARARRNGTPLCLATVDLDHFKQINDRHGHPAGDAVLRQVGEIIAENIRMEDLAGRLGGEEFALLLPGSDADEGRRVCERLRAAVASQLFELPDGGALRVTLSTGVALLGRDEDAGALMQRSDAALYEAKESGRNQVRLAA